MVFQAGQRDPCTWDVACSTFGKCKNTLRSFEDPLRYCLFSACYYYYYYYYHGAMQVWGYVGIIIIMGLRRLCRLFNLQDDRIITKCMEVALRATFYIFCKRNKNWSCPEKLNFYQLLMRDSVDNGPALFRELLSYLLSVVR